MTGNELFDENADDYDHWFDEHPLVYQAELEAVRKLLPRTGLGIEIGMGTGRFAAPLGITQGVEPSLSMRRIAEQRGLEPLDGVAEDLPYDDESFDYALMVTTICFVDNPDVAVHDAWRVLKPGGTLVMGFVDRNSPVGKGYEANRDKSRFYRDARFFSVDQIVSLMKDSGLIEFSFCQTIFHPLDEIKTAEHVKDGYGEGSFVVIAGGKIIANSGKG